MKCKFNVETNLLIIGPDYRNHRGGIGYLISIYKAVFPNVPFIATYRPYKSKFAIVLFFLKQLVVYILKLTFDTKIKIIHIHGSHRGSFYRKFIIFLVAKLFRKKIIYHLNSSDFIGNYRSSNKGIKLSINYMIKSVDALIVVSEKLKSEYESFFKTKNVKSIYNIILPVPINNYKVLQSKNKINFLFLGRIGENDRKGAFLLLEVISLLPYYCNINFAFGGDGDEINLFEEKIVELGISNRVQFLGWVSEKRKISIFENTDVFILPTYHEAQPLSILEAMNYSKAIISTHVASIPEVVENTVNGILIKAGDKEALKNAILYFINNPGEIERMGRESKKIVSKFYPENVLPELEKIYEELLAQ